MATDIDHSKIILAKTPRKLHPYIKICRFDRPIGIWLLLLPCLWSVVLAKGNIANLTFNELKIMALFTLGATLMRAAGCIINDIWDRKIDAKVERTKTRPLPSGEINIKSAFILLTVLLMLSLIVLLSLSDLAILLGLISIILVVIYPKMKQITWWPQLFLGFTFNWGALMGWAAINNSLSFESFLLYAGGVFWTLGYDTIYAHQDKECDILVGIKSTALLLKDKSKMLIPIFYTLSLALVITAKLLTNMHSNITYALCLLPIIYIIKQTSEWDINNSASCLKYFKSSKIYGILILLIMLS